MADKDLDLDEPLSLRHTGTTIVQQRRVTSSLVRCWASRLCTPSSAQPSTAQPSTAQPVKPIKPPAAQPPPTTAQPPIAKPLSPARPAASDTGSASKRPRDDDDDDDDDDDGTHSSTTTTSNDDDDDDDGQEAAQQAARRAEELQWQLLLPKTMTVHSCGSKVTVDSSLGNPLAKGPVAAPLGAPRVSIDDMRNAARAAVKKSKSAVVVPQQKQKQAPAKGCEPCTVAPRPDAVAAAPRGTHARNTAAAGAPVGTPAASGSGGSSQEVTAFAGQRTARAPSPRAVPILGMQRSLNPTTFAVGNTAAWMAPSTALDAVEEVAVDALAAEFAERERQEQARAAHKQAAREQVAKQLGQRGANLD